MRLVPNESSIQDQNTFSLR